MPKQWRDYALTFLACIVAVFAVSFLFPPGYEICHTNRYAHLRECSQYHFGPFALAWLAEQVDEHNGFVTAVATIIMAAFTGTLWLVTDRSVRLARAEFNLTHRPKIIVKSFQMMGDGELKVGEVPSWIFLGQNIGDSPAKVIQVRSGTIVLKAKEKIPTDISFSFHEDIAITLVSREKELFPGNGGSPLEGNQAMEIFAGSHVLLCMGVLVYTDEDGIQRETGFCRRYRSREREWDTITESEYEYAY
jgi:hypothetical protein